MKVGDYVICTGWNPDYKGKTGTIERIEAGHSLVKLDEIVNRNVASPGYIWWPSDQWEKIYTFKDLKFEEHPDFKSAEYDEFLKRQGRRKPDNLAEVANMTFDNGYSISVLFGVAFYSNGKDTYEIMCLNPEGNVLFKNEWGDEVLGNITSEEVTKWMIRLQTMKYQKRVYTAEDPYGEEEWEDTNEMRRSRFTPADHVIREINTIGVLQDIVINYGRQHGEAPFGEQAWNEFADYLKRRLIGKVCSFPVLGKNSKGEPEVHGAGHWTIDDIYLDDNFKVHFVGHGRNSDEKHDVILHIGKSVTDIIYYEDKMIMSPEDPYGEEEWELESKLYEGAKNLSVGDRVMYSPYNCEGTIVWKADDYSNEYMVEFDTPQPFAHNGKRGDAYDNGEFDPSYNDNRYYYVYDNTLELIEGKTPGKVRWYRKGKLHNESMITSFHAFRNL